MCGVILLNHVYEDCWPDGLSHLVLPVLSVDLFVLQYLNNQIAARLCDCWTFHDMFQILAVDYSAEASTDTGGGEGEGQGSDGSCRSTE